MCDDDCVEQVELAPVRFRWTDVAMAVLEVPVGLVEGIGAGLERLMDALGSHHNFLMERARFAKTASREINDILKGGGT
ncbi:MAG: hypothetical protein FWG25_06545 [Promicromonosporaceae bacterium]|nr:hypothetical protein [Promicromonosporaceae bacterium]